MQQTSQFVFTKLGFRVGAPVLAGVGTGISKFLDNEEKRNNAIQTKGIMTLGGIADPRLGPKTIPLHPASFNDVNTLLASSILLSSEALPPFADDAFLNERMQRRLMHTDTTPPTPKILLQNPGHQHTPQAPIPPHQSLAVGPAGSGDAGPSVARPQVLPVHHWAGQVGDRGRANAEEAADEEDGVDMLPGLAAGVELHPKSGAAAKLGAPEDDARSTARTSSDSGYGTGYGSRFCEEFTLKDRLGQGGFGRVYRAQNRVDSAEYAIKAVLVDTGIEDEARLSLREVRTWAQLPVHQNIVRYHW